MFFYSEAETSFKSRQRLRADTSFVDMTQASSAVVSFLI